MTRDPAPKDTWLDGRRYVRASDFDDMVNERNAALAELTALREDKARLDWFATECTAEQLQRIWVHSDPSPAKLRAAIDEQMALAAPGRKP